MTSAPAYTRFIISHLDEALALTRAATTLLLAAAAEIRKLPGTDIRDGQLSGSVREALAELDAACRRRPATGRGPTTRPPGHPPCVGTAAP